MRRGRADLQRYCVTCHGYAGDGHGPSAHRFDNAATDFTRGVYKCRSTPSGTLPSDDDLRRSIRHGLFDTGMPQFVALGPLQIEDLLVLLKSFSARFQREPQGQPIAVPPEPPRTPASVARGAALYDRLKCANCHGARGRGGGPGAANLRNDDGTDAHVTDLAGHYKCGDTPVRLYTTLMTGLDGTPMSGYAETTSPEEIWDLVQFVLSLSH
jgi:cytochrome c oxidase cbb3-type subunit 2